MNRQNDSTIKLYERNINNVINYITRNIKEPLTLDQLSQVACFSKYHFHRIFKALVGETVNEFRRRLQLEKAAHMLVYNPGMSITDIVMECGFSSSQNFAKAFKPHYQMTPSQFRKAHSLHKDTANSNIGNILSNPGKAINQSLHYNTLINDASHDLLKIDCKMDMTDKVVVEELPDLPVAYVRQIGEYTHDMLHPLYGKIIRWAQARSLMTQDAKLFGVCWDFVAVTPDEKCRYDACITIPAGYDAGGEVSTQVLPRGLFARYHCKVVNYNFLEHWDYLFRDWLPGSGYQAADRPCYEIMHNLRDAVPLPEYVIDICLPVKPL